MKCSVGFTIAVLAAGLSACSTEQPSAPSLECTKTTLADPANSAALALGRVNVYRIDDVACEGGWAVTSGLLAGRDNPSMGAPTSFVFRQEGQAWVVQDKKAVCGTNPVTTTPPADAKIPAALFLAGCAAG